MNRSDRLVLVVSGVIGLLVFTGIYLLGNGGENEVVGDGKGKAPLASYAVSGIQNVETFYFDPNTADSTQLLRLGLQPWQVRNIYRYRAKGGVYRKKEDFARLYGLTVKDYRRLEPYIRISPDFQPAASLFERHSQRHTSEPTYKRSPERVSGRRERDTTFRYPVKIREWEHVVLNTADTAMLRRVPGIGVYFANEIINHGRWLGGYVSVDQLDEISQFPKESKKYFVIEHPNPRKLNVNKLSLQELRRHPYINFYQAKAITDYRRLHGKINSLQDLRFSSDFTEADIQRLVPYVEY